jgi:hypothetical protein
MTELKRFHAAKESDALEGILTAMDYSERIIRIKRNIAKLEKALQFNMYGAADNLATVIQSDSTMLQDTIVQLFHDNLPNKSKSE